MANRSSRSAQDQRQRQEYAAWKLLEAVRDLFPKKFAELEDLRGVYDTSEPEEREELEYEVWRWTKQHRISCDAVNTAAFEFTEGRGDLPYEEPRLQMDDSIKVEFGISAVEAEPVDETLKEFLQRARKHYEKKRDFLARFGHARIRQREFDHFRYLAANRVGRYTWSAIAKGKALNEDGQPFKFPSKDLKTIAGEAGKIAALLGLAPGRRGRPRGSRDGKPRRRASR